MDMELWLQRENRNPIRVINLHAFAEKAVDIQTGEDEKTDLPPSIKEPACKCEDLGKKMKPLRMTLPSWTETWKKQPTQQMWICCG